MSNNVILLGAGASADAGIPLLGNFVDTIWNIARTGKYKDKPISKTHLKILNDFLEIRDSLEDFHGRASFDSWNLEQILSILTFTPDYEENSEIISKAIAATIDITCEIKHPKTSTDFFSYVNFWRNLLGWSIKNGQEIPTIITFNYDLVLERSLISAFSGDSHKTFQGIHQLGDTLKFNGLKITYGYEKLPEFKFKLVRNELSSRFFHQKIEDYNPSKNDTEPHIAINIFKLHGSVNFSKDDRSDHSLEKLLSASNNPLILPPVFNKNNKSLGTKIWISAYEALKNCKNLVVCGYSMPETDIYMQYFLKSSLGPNRDFNKIHVFDPTLFSATDSETIKSRYASIFSEPLRKRIVFRPRDPGPDGIGNSVHMKGSFDHFTRLIQVSTEGMFFE